MMDGISRPQHAENWKTFKEEIALTVKRGKGVMIMPTHF